MGKRLVLRLAPAVVLVVHHLVVLGQRDGVPVKQSEQQMQLDIDIKRQGETLTQLKAES